MSKMFNNIPTLPADKMPEGPYLSFDFNDGGPITSVIEWKVVNGVLYVVNERTTTGICHT
ncbi:hypothetical protein F0L74_09845 [Chitinophaga agrisoli]|uniref:Uncharacterized protein n=1 Tax=Chitinophaga agrisoli TaxID=2607653 RepID=A0A5B2VUB5_9BACT|nr:hypothetical protein [Chitinophaga agrisoli]KAA2242821.1 hypothetical protein F0L74_09845 [Chitinophaga agrisoli]